jgi:hypothetical protein
MRPSLSILAAMAGAALANSRPTAVVAQGVVVGTTTSLPAATATINKFLGIPFAQSPPERFGLPKPPSRFRGELDASQFKDACTQQFNCEFYYSLFELRFEIGLHWTLWLKPKVILFNLSLFCSYSLCSLTSLPSPGSLPQHHYGCLQQPAPAGE